MAESEDQSADKVDLASSTLEQLSDSDSKPKKAKVDIQIDLSQLKEKPSN